MPNHIATRLLRDSAGRSLAWLLYDLGNGRGRLRCRNLETGAESLAPFDHALSWILESPVWSVAARWLWQPANSAVRSWPEAITEWVLHG